MKIEIVLQKVECQKHSQDYSRRVQEALHHLVGVVFPDKMIQFLNQERIVIIKF